MKKQIKSWGNSLIILLNSEDSLVHNLKKGDIIDFEIKTIDRSGRRK